MAKYYATPSYLKPFDAVEENRKMVMKKFQPIYGNTDLDRNIAQRKIDDANYVKPKVFQDMPKSYKNDYVKMKDFRVAEIAKKPTYLQPTINKGVRAATKNDKVVQQGKVVTKPLNRPDNPFAPLLVNAANTASFGLLERNSKAIDQLKSKSPISSAIGSLAGYVLPASAGTKLLKPLTSKIAKPLAKRVVEGALVGGGISAGEGFVKDRGLKQTAKDVAINTALGGALDVGLYGAGKLVSKGIQKFAKKATESVLPTSNAITSRNSLTQPNGLKATIKRPTVESKIETPSYLKPQETPQATVKPLSANTPINSKLPTSKPIQANNIPPTSEIPSTVDFSGGKGESRFANVTVENSANTTKQLAKDLKELNLGYDKVTNEQSLIQANKRISEDVEKAVKYVADTKEGSAEHTTTAIQLINKFQKEGNYERAIDIASDISSKLTKNGQAIQAASIYDRLSPEGILLYAQRQVNKLNDERWFKGLTKEQKINPELAKQLQELSSNMKNLTGDAKTEASQELQQALQALGKSSPLRKLESAQTIGQLLNTKTMGRNIISNELFYRVERINKYIATPIDIARSSITGEARTVTFKTGNQKGYWEGWLKGTKAGWKGVNPGGLQTQYDLTAPAFSGKWNPLTYMEKTLGASLKGFDYAAYTRAVKQTVGEMGELAAINSKLIGPARKTYVQNFVKSADKNILDIADQYGKYVTFQDDNVLSKGLSAIKKGLNANKEFGIGSLVIKYPKTPGALIMRGMDYSAAGFLKSAYEVAKPLLKGGKIDTREATMALSRGITGTLGFTGLGYLLADKGVITGRTNKDADVRELQKQTGAGSYKVNLSALQRWAKNGFNMADLELKPNDTMYSYDWLAPVSMAISFGANINSNLKEDKNALKNVDSTIASSLEGAIGTIAEQPVLQGLTRQFQGYDLGQNATNTLKSIPSSFTPTLLNQVRQYQDNTGRSTYDKSPLKSALNMAQVKIPGLSSKLPAAYDTEGNQKENFQDGSNSFLNVFINPGFVSKNNPTPVQKEVLRIFDNSGLKTQFPSVAPKNIPKSSTNPQVDLTAAEISQYQKEIGQNTSAAFNMIINTNKYKNYPDAEKAKMLSNAMADAKEYAKIKLLKEKGLYWGLK